MNKKLYKIFKKLLTTVCNYDKLCVTEGGNMSISSDKTRLVAIVTKNKRQIVEDLAVVEKRSLSAMTAVLVDEALEARETRKNKNGRSMN